MDAVACDLLCMLTCAVSMTPSESKALGLCKDEMLNADGQAPPGRLYNGMIAPFVNTTVKAFLWYQGENNCGGTMGNSATGEGYGCQLPAMVAEWRRQWSAVDGTTAKLAPFGVVTLAAGGSEGQCPKPPPLATDNLLENTDGVLGPSRRGRSTPAVFSRGGSRLLLSMLTRALLMPAFHL